MKWIFFNSGANSGRFNMDFDLELTKKCKPGEAYFRLYSWKPYCISLGANQNEDSINTRKAHQNGIDVVFRPTGGRAILHAEEITYSVIVPADSNFSVKNLYRDINFALIEGLKKYDEILSLTDLESTQPHFPSFYKEDISAVCFAVPAKCEIKFKGKKLVGSAQRRLSNAVLQHGSILCGDYHKRLADYLNVNEESKSLIIDELNEHTIELSSILDDQIDYTKLAQCLKAGFEDFFSVGLLSDN